MGEYHIRGGNSLNGQVAVYGSKNAVLPILASSILNGGVSVIHNCPDISDTRLAIEILKALGCKVNFSDATITVDSSNINNHIVPHNLVRKMRSSIIFMGSLMGRLNEVSIGFPGGCELGARPIDFHIKAFKKMGAVINEEFGEIVCCAKDLTGQLITLDMPSVGATENIMLAGVLAKGKTIIVNAAKEPEVVDLQNFLQGMGAKIEGAGTDKIVITGVSKSDLHDVEHSIIADRIVAGTYLTAVAATGGEALLTGVISSHIFPIYSRLLETGCFIREEKNRIYIRAPKRLSAIERLTTLPHPGFPTDMQPQFMAMLCTAKGLSVINETVFEARNKHVFELRRMGADIIHIPSSCTSLIKGVKSLAGTNVEAKDLRGGAALIIAALSAEGKTIVQNSEHVERGYVNIEADLKRLGADIEFKQSE